MTQKQLEASDPGRSVWVSASAGTGKTKVLTDRVLRLLLEGTKPGSILCVTFTKAAAAEMLDRIERELAGWVVADDTALTESLVNLVGKDVPEEALKRARQLFACVLDAPDRLRVQTIHSFCQSVIARFPLEAGISPHVTLLDDHDAAEMLVQARQELFMKARKSPEAAIALALKALAQSLAESSLHALLEKIIHARRKFSPWLDKEGATEHFHEILCETLNLAPDANEEILLSKYFTYAPVEVAALKAASTILLQTGSKTDGQIGRAIESWLQEKMVQLYSRAFLTADGNRRKRLCTKDAEKLLPDLADILGREADRAELYMREWKNLLVRQSSEHMMVLARAMLTNYREEKTMRGVIDYDDLIMYTARLLSASGAAAWALFKLDGHIDHLLVDEAQDTSPEQWQIVEALVNEFFSGEGARRKNRTLFVVGDDKQSIFRFQGANPETFDRMRLTLSKRAKDAGKAFSHVRLDTSYRSTEAVLSAVDAVFALPDAREGLVFSENDLSHTAHRKEQPGRVEFWPLLEAEKKEKKTVWDDLSETAYFPSQEQRMAENIAAEIKQWLQKERLLPAHARPVRPGDIMILVQRRGGFASAMLRALKRAGIPVAGADRLVITEHIAVMDCMALAEFLLLPDDDLTLAALLKSPLIGLSEEALFKLAHGRGNHSLWEQMRAHTDCVKEVQFLSQMLARADYMPPYELFCHALVTLGKRKEISKRLGREADDPLNEFLSLALQYDRLHPPSLQGFMHWLRSTETEIKRDMEKGRDEIRILTVHASKGLQAPIIFLPDTTRVPRHPDNLQWNEAAIPVPLWSYAKEFDNEHLAALKDAARQDDYKEYRRLLYVAMTRAEDELYICGWKSEKAVQKNSWYELMRQAVEAGAWAQEDDRKVIAGKGNQLTKTKNITNRYTAEEIPEWTTQAAGAEPRPSKPLSPSRMTEPVVADHLLSAKAARARGVLIHRLLQYLPDISIERRDEVMKKFLHRYGEDFSDNECQEIVLHVTSVLEHPEFRAVFSEGSVAEVPIVGTIRGKDGEPITIAGQIDRLKVAENTVLIVDFKTGRDIPANAALIPVSYLRQMQGYSVLISEIYPGKAVKCAIIWTAGPLLMQLDVMPKYNAA